MQGDIHLQKEDGQGIIAVLPKGRCRGSLKAESRRRD